MTYPGMYFAPEMLRDFVRDLLGPALRNNSVTKDLKLMVYDDNRHFFEQYAKVVRVIFHVLGMEFFQWEYFYLIG
jgi:hypothetical protein